MIELYMKILSSIINDYHDKHWGKLIFKILGSLIVILCMGLLLGNLAILILDNIEGIVVKIGAIACFFMSNSSAFRLNRIKNHCKKR